MALIAGFTAAFAFKYWHRQVYDAKIKDYYIQREIAEKEEEDQLRVQVQNMRAFLSKEEKSE